MKLLAQQKIIYILLIFVIINNGVTKLDNILGFKKNIHAFDDQIEIRIECPIKNGKIKPNYIKNITWIAPENNFSSYTLDGNYSKILVLTNINSTGNYSFTCEIYHTITSYPSTHIFELFIEKRMLNVSAIKEKVRNNFISNFDLELINNLELIFICQLFNFFLIY